MASLFPSIAKNDSLNGDDDYDDGSDSEIGKDDDDDNDKISVCIRVFFCLCGY